MQIPESVLKIVKQAAKKFPADIPGAANWAEGRIRKLPDFADFAALAVPYTVRQLVHEVRHHSNCVLRRESNAPASSAKVRTGASASVNESYGSMYDRYIGGTTLGMLRGCDIPDARKKEQALVDGHSLNEAILARLEPLVKDEQLVRDVVSERQLRKIESEERRRLRGEIG